MREDAVQDVEIGLLLQGIRQVYGYNFLDYAESSLQRRLRSWLATSGFATFSQAQDHILRDVQVFESLLQGITVNVTEMFRDPPFFRSLREQVLPYLKTYPHVKIWHAGCASGEEAYSMAILLQEAGMQDRYHMYATDINESVLKRAKDGIYPLKTIQDATRNYQKSGGHASFADYYTARYENSILASSLRQNIVFASHNLTGDTGLGEMHLVMCRNVLIYFKSALKEHCLAMFDNCISPGGFLCLGSKERLDDRKLRERYEEIAPRTSIYRKTYA
jgi:chemotaxis protein methyltransferase CheR